MNVKLMPEHIWSAIDIGTTKICVLIAHARDDADCEIIGIGKSPSYGLDRGVVVDANQASKAIKVAVNEAELMAGIEIESVYIGVSGGHIVAMNSHGMIPIKHGIVRDYDVANAIEASKSVPLSEDQQILHVLPQRYRIDGHAVRDPVGMHGMRLEVDVHIIIGRVSSVHNIVNCCQSSKVHVRDIILEPLASAEAVLSSDERELGVGMLDIGGGTADLALYQERNIRHTKIFPVAGNLFTRDLALCLRTSIDEAARIKHAHGSVMKKPDAQNHAIDMSLVHGEECKSVTVNELAFILEARAEELLDHVVAEFDAHDLYHLAPAGFVLTGGGSLLAGIDELTQKKLGLPSRIGRPRLPATFQKSLHTPVYATSYGLLLYAMKQEKQHALNTLSGPLVSRVFWRMKSWIADFF
jgi:cell division protein FtsA